MISKWDPLKQSAMYDYYREIPREDATPLEAVAITKKKFKGLNSLELQNVLSATILNLKIKGLVDIKLCENAKKDGKVQISLNHLEKAKANLEGDELLIYSLLEKIEKKYFKITNKTIKKYIRSHEYELINLRGQLALKCQISLENKGIVYRDIDYKHFVNITRTYIFLYLFFAYFFLRIFFDELGCHYRENFTLVIPQEAVVPVALGLIIILLIVSQFIHAIYVLNKTTPFTQKGMEEHFKWQGLKKYMEDYSSLEDKGVMESNLWEKYLVYATAFGIAKTTLDQIKATRPEDWIFDWCELMHITLVYYACREELGEKYMENKLYKSLFFTFMFILLLGSMSVFAGNQQIQNLNYEVQINADGSMGGR